MPVATMNVLILATMLTGIVAALVVQIRKRKHHDATFFSLVLLATVLVAALVDYKD